MLLVTAELDSNTQLDRSARLACALTAPPLPARLRLNVVLQTRGRVDVRALRARLAMKYRRVQNFAKLCS